jgi:serine/threonine protein kinase
MSHVRRASDLRLGRDVALKPLEPGSADRPDARARLRREARALAELDGADRRVLDAAEEAGVGWPRRGGV